MSGRHALIRRLMGENGPPYCNIGREILSDHATMTAADLAFYSLLGIVPVLIALSTIYSLIADPVVVDNLVEGLRGFMPGQRYRTRRAAERAQ